jgi:hypothetical protein
MNVTWQDAVTLGLVTVAVIYLIRRLRRLGRGQQRTGCGTCPNCRQPPDQTPLISIDPPKKSL